jgi:hypothetical protein
LPVGGGHVARASLTPNGVSEHLDRVYGRDGPGSRGQADEMSR